MTRSSSLVVVVLLMLLTVGAAEKDTDVRTGPSNFLVDVEDEHVDTDAGRGHDVLDTSPTGGTSTDQLGPDTKDLFCLGTNWTESCDPEEVEPVLTLGMVTSAFRRVPIPATPLVIEPVDGVTLVNLPTNFHTPAEPFTRTVTLLGRRIRLEITPVAWAWSFGDGSTVTTDTPGAPYPDLEVTHAYLRAGRVAPSVATTYTATFSVDGGPAQPVPGSVTIPSPPAALEVTTATARLTDPTR